MMFAAYATVPVYEAFFRGMGWGEAIDPMVTAWREGDRKAAVGHVPEDLCGRSSSSATRLRCASGSASTPRAGSPRSC